SDYTFNDLRHPVTALRHQDLALEHIGEALSCYDTADDREKAQQLHDEIQEKREVVLDYLENLVQLPDCRSSDSNG
ncbi:hypothetical protein, partial [Burkholderia ambifaria]|uniref:hypothetical protein n=1 Tax=Burkholderia ambifaria TaxID=152480 RepID=UPI001E38BEFF